MNDTHPPQALTEALPEPAQDQPLGAAAEARLQAWLRARVETVAMERRRRQRTRRVVVVSGLCAAAAAVLLVVTARDDTDGTDAVATSPAPAWHAQPAHGATLTWFDPRGYAHRVAQAGTLGTPDRIETDDASTAQLTSPGGVILQLSPGTRLRTPRPRDRARAEVHLDRGQVEVDVPTLGPARAFAVHTVDSEVIVHGTRFRVTLQNGGDDAARQDSQTHTCVQVHEGKVEVRNPEGTFFIGPGESAGCDRPRPRTRRSASRRPARAVPTPRADGPRPAPAERGTPEGSVPAGTLAEQNRLLSEALAAERKGDLAGASRAFRTLLQRYPDSPLGPDARRGLGRLSGQDARP